MTSKQAHAQTPGGKQPRARARAEISGESGRGSDQSVSIDELLGSRTSWDPSD